MFPRIAPWCFAALLHATFLGAQQYDLRTYSLEHGAPSATVNALCEDTAGYLWIGTNEGVSRTDGVRFWNFGRAQGLPNDDITALQCATDGSIWIGCRNGAVVRMTADSPFTVVPGDTATGAIQKIVITREGDVWIATTTNGIWRIAGEKAMKDPTPGLPDASITSLAEDAHGRLICSTADGLYVKQRDHWDRILQHELPEQNILSLFADANGILAGTAHGLVEITNDLGLLPPADRSIGLQPIALPSDRILAIMRSESGDIWLGTPAGAVQISRRNGIPFVRSISEANGLGHDLVRALHQDRSGAIWFGTLYGGASRFMSDAYMHFTDRDGLRSSIVSGIHRTPDGLLWIATLGGGAAVWNDRELRTIGKDLGLADRYVTTLGEDDHGFLLAGTGTQGVFRWNGANFQHDPLLSPAGCRIQTISQNGGKLFIGHDKGLRIVDQNGAVRDLPVRSGVFDLDHHGDTTWIASGSGLCFIADQGIRSCGLLSPHTVRSLTRDSKGNLWIGTDGNGLFRLNGSEVDSISTEHNSMGSGRLASNTVLSVLLDAYENIWAGTRHGIHQLELDVMQEMILDVQHYGAADGFIGIETFRNASMLDHDSTLWFGTLRGATRYDPLAVKDLQEPPKLHLTGLQLFFENVDWSRWSHGTTYNGIPIGLELPYNRNHLTFNFTGISLAYPEQIRYRYKLEGHDMDWSPITTSDRVIYSNIPPGDYIFMVLARNASGLWTDEPLEYRFTIVAPIWQRTWLQVLAFLFLASMIYTFIRYREKRAKRIREKLEGMVQARTSELAQEKQRSDELLLNILPRSTAEELKRNGNAHTRKYDNCTVLFSDFTGFTSMSSQMDGHDLVTDLDHYFRLFDRITDRYGIEKIKTIGDAYMCASGIPEPKPTHALDAILMALEMMRATHATNQDRIARGEPQWMIRIGMHSGPIVAGVVGEKKFAYDIWGNTVNVASRMESNSLPGRINISGATYAQVMDLVEASPRGPIKVRGKGELHMYFVDRLRPAYSADPEGTVPNDRLLSIREEMLSVVVT